MSMKKYIVAVVALVVLALPTTALAGWTWDDRSATNQIYPGDGGGPGPNYGDECSFWMAGWESNGLRCINVNYGRWQWR